jgi:hypothetical protein
LTTYDKYIKGVYYQNPELKGSITNEKQKILNALKKGYPNGFSAKDLSEGDQKDKNANKIDENTAYQLCKALAKDNIIIRKSKEGKKKRLLKKYYFEDYNYVYNQREDFRGLFAPGYVQYEDIFLDQYDDIFLDQYDKKIKDKELEVKVEDIYRGLTDFLREAIRRTNRRFNRDDSECENCGYNHEKRDFIRAILLHLIDGLEMNRQFIEFIHDRSVRIVTDLTYNELIDMAKKQTTKLVEPVKTQRSEERAPVVLHYVDAEKHATSEQIGYDGLEDIPQQLFRKIQKYDNNMYEAVVKHYFFSTKKERKKKKEAYISNRDDVFDINTPRPLPNRYYMRIKLGRERLFKLCANIIKLAGLTESGWWLEY